MLQHFAAQEMLCAKHRDVPGDNGSRVVLRCTREGWSFVAIWGCKNARISHISYPLMQILICVAEFRAHHLSFSLQFCPNTIHVENVRISQLLPIIIGHGIKPPLSSFCPLHSFSHIYLLPFFTFISYNFLSFFFILILAFHMDSSYLLNHAALSSYLGKEDSSIIDLGLSLRIVQPDPACYSHNSHGTSLTTYLFIILFFYYSIMFCFSNFEFFLLKMLLILRNV